MLDTVIQSTPWALVLTNASERVVYSNVAARQLFHAGRRFEGHAFTELLQKAPETLREAVESGRDGMFSVQREDEDEIYYLSPRALHPQRAAPRPVSLQAADP